MGLWDFDLMFELLSIKNRLHRESGEQVEEPISPEQYRRWHPSSSTSCCDKSEWNWKWAHKIFFEVFFLLQLDSFTVDGDPLLPTGGVDTYTSHVIFSCTLHKSNVYFFSSTLYLHSAQHFLSNVKSVEGINHCAFVQGGVCATAIYHLPTDTTCLLPSVIGQVSERAYPVCSSWTSLWFCRHWSKLSDDRPRICQDSWTCGVRTLTRERSDWQSPADWSSSDQTRERTDWQSAAQMKRDGLRHGSHQTHGSKERLPHIRGRLQGHPWRRR